MSGDRLRRAEALFHQVLGLPPDRRREYIELMCGDDDGLKGELQSLLAHEAEADAFLESPPPFPETSSGTHDQRAPWRVGQRAGHYVLGERLGAGGMGEVYRARDTVLGRDVALKVLPPEFAADSARMARFRREARTLASLNHPNIATIYGVDDAQGVPAIAMELVEGTDLDEVIRAAVNRTGRGLAVHQALALGSQIAGALDAAHERGIVHRDLKPANVMVTRDGAVKVLDFGLAKSVDPAVVADQIGTAATRTVDVTRPGTVMGTAAYMSPEQARGDGVDKRTDIWAFGCVLFEMLTGHQAFGGRTLSDTLVAVLERDPDWAALPSSTPPTVVRVVRQCLEKEPTRRRRDIADVKLDLEDAARSSSSPPVVAGPAARVAVRAWAVAGALATLVMVVLAIVLVRRPAVSRENGLPIELTILPPAGTFFPLETGAPWPSVSPDGRQLAFIAATTQGVQQLWIRRLDSAAARPLAGTAGAVRPFWAPDSSAIGFFADGKIKRIDLSSGVVQTVCDAQYLGGMSATWGKNVILFTHVGGFFRVPAAGGKPELVLRDIQAEGGNRNSPQNPDFLPDGRRFLYVTQRATAEEDQLCLGSLDATEIKCFANISSPVRYADPGYVLYVRDNTLRLQPFSIDRGELFGESTVVTPSYINVNPVYRPPPFSISSSALVYRAGTGLARLTWVDRAGRVLETIGDTGDSGVATTTDGSRVIVSRTDPQYPGNVDLWMRQTAGAWTRFTFDPRPDTGPVFSPDGSRVAFARPQGAVTQLFVKPTNGLEPEQQISLPPASEGAPQDWSADGQWLFYGRYSPTTGWDIGRVAMSGRGAAQLVVHSGASERDGKLSPDMHWIAYDSTESGRREIWIEPMPPTGSRWQVSTKGGTNPRWRADGHELFYTSPDGDIVAVPVASGSVPTLGTPVSLFRTQARGPFRVSADGQRFLINAPPSLAETEPITVIVNWQSTLVPATSKGTTK